MSRLSEDRLELALRASNEGIWKWVVGEPTVMYSERVLGFLGESSHSAPNIFTDTKHCFHENDVPKFKRALTMMLKPYGRELFAVDCRYLRSDGVQCWLRIRGACVRDEQGNALRMAGSMIDISKRKTAEMALEEERHLLRQLIENIPNNVYFKDKESRFVMANHATAAKMKLASTGELVGKIDRDFFDDRHADKSRQDEINIMESGLAQEESLERETWPGKEDTWVITTKIPWLDHNGEVRGTFGVSSDVSDLINTQIRLKHVAEELKLRHDQFEEELHLAREVQQASLDEAPDDLIHPSTDLTVKFATRYQPDSEMAGDFYEFIRITDTQVGVLISDVMGHGVRAALVVAMLRGLIEKERHAALHPDWFLYGLNESLAQILNHAGISMFATALYVVVDLDKQIMSYASAGHPLPLVGKDGKFQVVETDKIVRGPALGLKPEAPYGCDTLPLSEIDQMILYTDGIYEVENSAGHQLGIQAICDYLKRQTIRSDIDTMLGSLMDFSAAYAGGKGYGDDVCLLGLDVL